MRGQQAGLRKEGLSTRHVGRRGSPLTLVTVSGRDLDSERYRDCEVASRGTDVEISFLLDGDDDLLATLRDRLSDGGCACVLRDTVSRAQETYEFLKTAMDAEVRLVHSRFIAADRLSNDAELLKLLGPNASKRPRSLVVVGTQVIEQSLDIDFDFMITDIAPIDLLLQRMGRLHRHQRGEGQSERSAKLRTAQCFITGSKDWSVEPPEFDKGIIAVYHPALLLRTILALKVRCDGVGVLESIFRMILRGLWRRYTKGWSPVRTISYLTD